jgi:hypothetical protein
VSFRIKMLLLLTYGFSCFTVSLLSLAPGPSISDFLMAVGGLWAMILGSIAIVTLILTEKGSDALKDKIRAVVGRIFKV